MIYFSRLCHQGTFTWITSSKRRCDLSTRLVSCRDANFSQPARNRSERYIREILMRESRRQAMNLLRFTWRHRCKSVQSRGTRRRWKRMRNETREVKRELVQMQYAIPRCFKTQLQWQIENEKEIKCVLTMQCLQCTKIC